MKKIVLGISILLAGFTVNAQTVIQVNGEGADVSGTIIDVELDNSSPSPYQKKFIVTNNTGSNQQWRITRVRVDVPETWSDLLCWPPNCYPTNGLVYQTPNTAAHPAPVIVNGTNQTSNNQLAEMKPMINVNDQSEDVTALYMYYITDLDGNYVDSVGLRINFTSTLGTEEASAESVVTVAPNPADSQVAITIDQEGAVLEMTDSSGKIVQAERTIGYGTSIDLSAFPDGVYFLRIRISGTGNITKRLVVHH